jgi:malonate-semialdehyde dehydrogenase (acetylating)/methylmalonate-semialdehyde dehydrogenase
MPDANFDRSIGIITESFYGCAGERCLAGSMLVPVGDAHVESRDRLVASARALKVGDGTEPGVTMGPVISAGHKERVLGYIDKGVAEGAKLLVDGRGTRVADRPRGYFVAEHFRRGVAEDVDRARRDLRTGCVDLSVKTLDEAIAMMKAHPTRTRRRSSRRAARRP